MKRRWKVIEALEHMSEVRLANQLRNKYCCTEAQIECETAASQTSLEPSDSQVTEKVLKVDKQDTVAKKIEEFGEKYLKLVGKSESALKSANPQPREIKRFSAYYEMASSDEVTTVEKLFDQLEPLYFLDYAMLEKIVKFFLDQAQPVVGELNDYIQELNEFKSSTTVQQFMESIEVALESHTTIERPKAAVTVTLRLVGGWLKKSITDLHLLLKELFREKSSVLSLLKILPGSVIVTFLAPQREADSLIMFAREKVSFMLQVGLCEVQVGDTVITSTQIETSNFSFESSLLKAVKRNDADVLSLLLDINTSPDAIDDKGKTALWWGSYLAQNEAVSLLLKANVNPNLLTKNDGTPLFIASLEGRYDIVSLLLKANANPNLQNGGLSPLYIASQDGHFLASSGRKMSTPLKSLHIQIFKPGWTFWISLIS